MLEHLSLVLMRMFPAGVVYWSEHGSGQVRRLWQSGRVDTLREESPPLYDLRLVDTTSSLQPQGLQFYLYHTLYTIVKFEININHPTGCAM